MPYVSINNTNLYFEEEGKGKETLVFGHSMLFNLRMFDSQVACLKNNYRCVRFDFKGHGKSESALTGYDLDSHSEDIIELINLLDCRQCHFIGFSMGGMVALRIALKNPELIKSLILIDTSSEPEPTHKMLKNKAMLFIAKHVGLKPIANQVMSLFFGPDFLKDSKRSPLREKWKKYFISNNRTGIVKAVKGVLFRKGISDQISKINHPTKILVGANDGLTDISKANILHANIENSSLEIIPRTGHMSPVEEPDIVNNIIKEHLKDFQS